MYYTYAVGLKFIAACEGSPHNVIHSSSEYCWVRQTTLLSTLTECTYFSNFNTFGLVCITFVILAIFIRTVL